MPKHISPRCAHHHARALFLSLLFAAPAFGQEFEDAPRVSPAQILSDSSLQSGNHRVLDEVDVDRNYLVFLLGSDFGTYRVRGLPMLTVRIREVRTLAQAIDRFDRQNQKLADDLRGLLTVGGDSAVDILTSPLQTSSRLVGQFSNNVGRTFSELNDLTEGRFRNKKLRSGPGGASEHDPIIASHRRAVAGQLDLDVFSTNPRVQEFLTTVARARAGGQPSAGTVNVSLPRGEPARVADGRIDSEVRSAITRMTANELYQRNATVLGKLGVEEAVIDRFLGHPGLSPRHRSEIASLLTFIGADNGAGAALEATLSAEDETDALARVEMIRMLALYHERREPIGTLLGAGHLVVGVTRASAMVVAMPFDLLFWDRRTAESFTAIAEHARSRGYTRSEILIGGILSSLARERLTALGFNARERYTARP